MTRAAATLVAVAAVVTTTALRAPYTQRIKANRAVDSRLDGLEWALRLATWFGVFLLPVLYAVTDWLDFADYQRFRPTLAWAGACALVPAVWLFWRSHRDLGRHWSPTLVVHEEQVLVTTGVYSAVRHPMYASVFVWGVASWLLLQNWIIGPSTLVAFGLTLLLRVPREERMLRDRFGEAYRDYTAHTKRLVPGLW